MRHYRDLYKVIPAEVWARFKFCDYQRGERTLLQPALEKLGYTEVRFVDGEADSQGPLSRICSAWSSEGHLVHFIYG